MYYEDDEMKVHEIGENVAYNVQARDAYTTFVRQYEGKNIFVRSRHRW
jgi:hypothetical protein